MSSNDDAIVSTINPRSFIFSMKFRMLLMMMIFFGIAYVFQCNLPFILGKLESFGVFVPFGFLLLYCLVSVLCLPTFMLVLAGGAFFGPVAGTLINLLGATLGAACGFGISRYLKPANHVIKNSRIQKMMMQVERQGWKSVALLRLTPAVPYNLVNYGFGLTHINFSTYLIATLIFLVPNKIIVTCCGYYGVNAFDYTKLWHLVRAFFQ